MGTSSSQRSPATPEWERVRELYRQPHPDPGEVAGRIVAALDPATRKGLSDRGVALCLDTALVAVKEVSETGLRGLVGKVQEPAALQAAAVVRQQAQERIVRDGAASRFAELALDGLAVAVMEVASGGQAGRLLTASTPQVEEHLARVVREGRLHVLARTFLGYDFDRVFRYFVSRDLSDFVGSAAFPDVGHAQQLLDRVAYYCRRCVTAVSWEDSEPVLQAAVARPEPERLPVVQDFLTRAVGWGLDAIAAGGVV
jgi:hypothetical protein